MNQYRLQYTYLCNNTRNLPVQLSLFQIRKNTMFFLCFLFNKVREQEGGTGSAQK
jgi:hypothetical protein